MTTVLDPLLPDRGPLVIFDVETIFLYPWAVMFDRLALFGFIEMTVFLAILIAGYVYVWNQGGASIGHDGCGGRLRGQRPHPPTYDKIFNWAGVPPSGRCSSAWPAAPSR